jgi:putative tricarboxylic transport membrane protein
MRKADITAACALIIFGLTMLFVIIPAQTDQGEEYGVPPSTLPMAAVGLVTAMAVLLLIQRLRSKEGKDEPNPIGAKQWVHIGTYALVFSAGLALIKFLHFIPGGIVFIAGLMLITGQRKPLIIILVSGITPVLVYSALWYGLRIPLP